MKWVFTVRVEPPSNEVISVRFGGSVMFAAYSPALRQWFHVYPGGEQRIETPPMWFCSDEWAATHQREDFREVRSTGTKLNRRSTKAVQLSLFG